MSDFYVGQEVVCVDDLPQPGYESKWDGRLTAGAHYIVRWVGWYDNSLTGVKEDCVRLVGVDRATTWKRDTPYALRRFRPIKSESIQIFREMCRTVKRNIDA